MESLKKLFIKVYPDPVLRRACTAVNVFDDQIAMLADRLIDLMRDASGVGLAAPQVGISQRLFVCNLSGDPEDDKIFVNPRITELAGAEEAEEGCLSIPSVQVIKRRATRAVIEACDIHGVPFTATGEGLLVRIWQHELDHLQGRLIIDNMSAEDEISNRRALRELEADAKVRSGRKGRKKHRG